jgi:cytochrome c-type biogenesis protein CcmH/NrfG
MSRTSLVALFLCSAVLLSGRTPEWERAYSLVQKADYQQAVTVLEKAPDKDPDNLQLLGEAWLGLKEFKKAVDVLERAAEIAPKSSTIQLWLGRAWGRRAEANKLMAFSWARKAKDAFERAVALDGKNHEALDDLFEYYVEAPAIVGGGLDKAEVVAKQIAAMDAAKGQRAMDRLAKARGQAN